MCNFIFEDIRERRVRGRECGFLGFKGGGGELTGWKGNHFVPFRREVRVSFRFENIRAEDLLCVLLLLLEELILLEEFLLIFLSLLIRRSLGRQVAFVAMLELEPPSPS